VDRIYLSHAMGGSTGRAQYGWKRHGVRAAMAIGIALQARAAGIVSLQNANSIGVAGLVPASVTVSGNSTANIGLGFNSTTTGQHATETINTGVTLTGTVFYDNSDQISNCTRASGGCVTDASDLGPGGTLVTNAANDFTNAAALTPTQTFTTINGSTGLGDLGNNNDTNVISISTINLTSNLTITGTAADYFILQVAGNVTLNSHSILLGGTLLASHVLIVLTGASGSTVSVLSGDTLNGSLLSNNAHYTFTIDGTVNGAVINDAGITLNGAHVVGADAFDGVPEPATWGLMAAGLAGTALLRRRSKRANASR